MHDDKPKEADSLHVTPWLAGSMYFTTEQVEDAGDTPAIIARWLSDRFEAELISESPPAEAPDSWRDRPPLL